MCGLNKLMGLGECFYSKIIILCYVVIKAAWFWGLWTFTFCASVMSVLSMKLQGFPVVVLILWLKFGCIISILII